MKVTAVNGKTAAKWREQVDIEIQYRTSVMLIVFRKFISKVIHILIQLIEKR
ncbi:hypothetical protein KCP75_00060 [Salmonella enterica subsp. enterica]|nr:hypothetical protein KCP75_00060 [Salmonella enterica subsp. enterica]